MDKIEKIQREEKEKERNLMRKIRDLKVKQSENRRERVRNSDQPAKNRRKTGSESYKRVEQDERNPVKSSQLNGIIRNFRTRVFAPGFYFFLYTGSLPIP